MDKQRIELACFRPRLSHQFGDGYVLSVTVEELFNPNHLQELLKDYQTGYIRVILEKAS